MEALFYSLCENAKLVGVEPRAYLLQATHAALEERRLREPDQKRRPPVVCYVSNVCLIAPPMSLDIRHRGFAAALRARRHADCVRNQVGATACIGDSILASAFNHLVGHRCLGYLVCQRCTPECSGEFEQVIHAEMALLRMLEGKVVRGQKLVVFVTSLPCVDCYLNMMQAGIYSVYALGRLRGKLRFADGGLPVHIYNREKFLRWGILCEL